MPAQNFDVAASVIHGRNHSIAREYLLLLRFTPLMHVPVAQN